MRVRWSWAGAFLAIVLALLSMTETVSAAPSITSFNPTKGALGTGVSIIGTGFTGATTVTFGGARASFRVVSDTLISTAVPVLAVTGKITVGTASSTSSFTVLPGVSLSPGAGPPTSKILVSGSGFGANELLDIYENSTDVLLGVTDAGGTFSNLGITVPAWMPPGILWITAAGRRTQLAAQKPFIVRTDWSNVGRVRDGSYNAFENTLDIYSVGKLEEAWTTAGANFLSNGPPGVIAVGGFIIGAAAVHGTVVALNPVNGSEYWHQTIDTSFFSGPSPAYSNGIVVVASTDGKVHALNLGNGAPIWTSVGPSDTGNGSPVALGAVAFVPGATTLNAFNLSTGAILWSYTGPCTGNLSAPAISAGTLVFTCTNSSGGPVLVSLGTDGTFYHWFSVAAGTTSAPAIHGGTVYTLLGGNLIAYSLSGFNPKWTVTPPISVSTDPAVGDGIVATCGGGGLWVLNAANGSTRFTNTTYACSARPTIANGVIYEPRNGDIVMFDEYGTLLGRLGSGGNVGPVTVSDGAIYVADSIAGLDAWNIPNSPGRTHPSVRPDVRQLHPDLTLKPYRKPICVRPSSPKGQQVCVPRH